MNDLISRQAAITIPATPKEDREYQTYNLDDAYEQAWEDLQKRIEQLPPVQPETCAYWDRESNFCALHRPSTQPERKTGEWIEHEYVCECPYCHEEWDYCDNDTHRFRHCPNCGAKMDKEKENDKDSE